MPKINITEKEMLILREHLPEDSLVLQGLEEKIILAGIPKRKDCDVVVVASGGVCHVVRGQELTGRWAIAPSLKRGPIEGNGLFSNTRKAIIHRPSGRAVAYGTKERLLIFWYDELSAEIRDSVELDDPEAIENNLPEFKNLCEPLI